MTPLSLVRRLKKYRRANSSSQETHFPNDLLMFISQIQQQQKYGDHYMTQGQKSATTVRHETCITSRSDGIVQF